MRPIITQKTIIAQKTALTGCGNCKIVFGTYVGDGNYDHSPTLESDSAPVALCCAKNFLSHGCIKACNKSVALHLCVGQNFCSVLFLSTGGRGAKASRTAKIRLQRGVFCLNYTENYQLNQWAKSDRVLMEDFNSDNAKIDAALNNTKNSIYYEKMLHTIIGASTEKISIDVQAIDFTKYANVRLYCAVPLAGAAVTLRLNGSTGNDYCRTYCSTSQSDNVSDVSTDSLVSWRAQLEQIPAVNISFHAPASGAAVVCDYRYVALNQSSFEYANYISAAKNVTWDTLKTLDFSCKNYFGAEQNFPVGSEVILYGLRK